MAAPGEGVARYTGPTRTSTPVTIAGFPALVVSRPAEKFTCFVVVDVAYGESLQVQRDDDTGPTLDQICSGAQSLAETAMTALLSQK